ncbi:aminotransferase class V-fold PLP-dependent enzyme [Frankia sp. AiPs1]|uniref:aminotransferase class V-fold PLP-dependent enzyme n=1 Tax=Frankia sp. AiPs1 TaxID=573493 RepID=UPI002043BAF2|nr:aminotransferase class V-fold PLP-dependent enzyme [Frankia sp. AiPs1]MCM3922067.1 aminotransferase class V-fold PLP-dependent enzyme [Frankia sp. AiPs1]
MTHLDAAAAGRPSQATLDAQISHLRREGERGAYVAEMEACEVLHSARTALADLLGPGLGPDEVTFHHSASTAFAALLPAWPLSAGARVGVLPSEYGSNMLVLEARAGQAPLELIDLPVDPQGVIDLDVLDRAGIPSRRADRPLALDELDLVVFPHVPSQHGLVQPAVEIGRRCVAAGVPLVLDVAQSLGQIDVSGIHASAYVGTSRKWLCGPRGTGFLAVRGDLAERINVAVPSLYSMGRGKDGQPVPLPGLARLSIGEASIASRVGLAQALSELLASDPPRVFARIVYLASYARRVLDGAGGWRVREWPDSPTGIVTLEPPPGVDPVAVRDRLYRHDAILTSAIPVQRSRDLGGPVLRVSAHVYNDPAEFERLAAALNLEPGNSPRA